MATPPTTPITKNYKPGPSKPKYLSPNSATPTTLKMNTNSVMPPADQTHTTNQSTNNLLFDNSELPTYNFEASDNESKTMRKLSRTTESFKNIGVNINQ